MPKRSIPCAFIAFLAVTVAVPGQPAAPVFTLPTAGCPMIHCDVRMSDRVNLAPPAGPNIAILAHDTTPTGSGNPYGPNHGAGCASNGHIVACSYNNSFGDNVVAYNATGARLWSSGGLFGIFAFASVPLVSKTGDVIAVDDSKVVRFDSSGQVLWNTATPGGTPISPVLTSGGAVILATLGGPISAFDNTDGHLIGSLYVNADSSNQHFDTINTPCVVNNRFYVSMQLQNDPANTARLVAVDYVPADPINPLKVAWSFTFGGPSGASPTCIGNGIYFDGGRRNPGDPPSPQLFGVRDDGSSGTLLWARTAPADVPASFSQDPRGGVWVEYTGLRSLQRRSTANGSVLESLDVATLVGDPIVNVPRSVLTMAGTASAPVLILGTQSASVSSSYVVAIDLNTKTLLWKKNLTPSLGTDSAPVQFPVALTAAGKPVVVFSGRSSGAYFLTAK